MFNNCYDIKFEISRYERDNYVGEKFIMINHLVGNRIHPMPFSHQIYLFINCAVYYKVTIYFNACKLCYLCESIKIIEMLSYDGWLSKWS